MKRYRGTAIIEMTYIMPLVIFVWIGIIFMLFYFHDKNILTGAAYETAVVGSELYHSEEKVERQRVENYFQKRIDNKLLFFSGAEVEVKTDSHKIYVSVRADEKKMKVLVKSRAELSIPERDVRRIKVWKDRIEERVH